MGANDVAGDQPADDGVTGLRTVIAQLNQVLEELDHVGVPLACAYVDLAVSLCTEELEKRIRAAG
jgi:hypothetical protein